MEGSFGDPEEPQPLQRLVEVSPRELQGLTPETLSELQRQHGLVISIRSSSAGIGKILSELGRQPSSALVAKFDRGYDRTQGGDPYDRFYDRDRNIVMEPGGILGQPGLPFAPEGGEARGGGEAGGP
jgi:hypothetical protein